MISECLGQTFRVLFRPLFRQLVNITLCVLVSILYACGLVFMFCLNKQCVVLCLGPVLVAFGVLCLIGFGLVFRSCFNSVNFA